MEMKQGLGFSNLVAEEVKACVFGLPKTRKARYKETTHCL